MKNESKEQQYKKMTETPVEQLIIRLGIPTTISMLVTGIYNMADTYFVSTLGNSASGAVGVVFALMAIIQAFGFTCGQGAGSILSRKLGKGLTEEARQTASTGFYMAVSIGLLIMIGGLIFIEPLMVLIGSTPTILPYASDYARFILLAAPVMTGSCLLNNVLRYEGKATFAMVGLVSGGIINILGDYLLIMRFGLGIRGAGLSTMISQYLSFVILLLPFLRKQVQTRVGLRYISREIRVYGDIFAVGFPSLLRQGLSSVSTMVLNWCAAPYGDAAIAAMSIVTRTNMFLFSVTIGIGQGFQPVSAFNYGARKYDRVKKALKFTILLSTCMMAVMSVLGFIFARDIVTAFRDDPQVIEIGSTALRITVPVLVMLPFSTGVNMLCQSIGRKLEASLLSSTRCGLFYIPLLFTLSHFFGLRGIECTQLCSDILGVLVSIPIMFSVFRSFEADEQNVG